MEHLGDKLLAFREAEKKNQAQMADFLGIGERTYQDIEKTGNVKKVEDLIKITNKTGIQLESTQIVAESAQSYTKTRNDKKNNGEKKAIPVYGGYSTLGNIVVYDDENTRNEVIGTLPPNIFPNCDYAEKAKGDSMYPLIMNQALLVGKKCTPKGIVHGEKYIIKTRDGLDTTKFVHPVKDENGKNVAGRVLLVAHNKHIPPQEIEINDITFSCRVHWIVNPT